MKHRKVLGKLNRNTSHRRALLRNLATALVLKDKIETTLPRAKELKRLADKLVTIGKKDTLAARRQAMGFLFAINRTQEGNVHKLTAVHKLFTEIAPRYKNRNGGYTRVIHSGRRAGDCAEMAVIEFVESEITKKAAPKKRRIMKKATALKDNEETVTVE
ncbi:MAG: 50S ribosomal protein L17 [Deltaproteobacteria bacterium]|jgi:large subunit ribosomal protein L17|nr:50S ribosomal protein L17 [Deltaproteobacteria bacterium]